MSEEKTGHIFADEMGDAEERSHSVIPIIPFPMLAELPDLEADQYLVLRCARAMTAKLATSRAKGRGGWHTPECDDNNLRKMLLDHVEKGDMVDVLNIAGMILVRQESVSVTQPIMLGTTGGTGTRAEKLRDLLKTSKGAWTGVTQNVCGEDDAGAMPMPEQFNWTTQNVCSEDDAGAMRVDGCVNDARDD